MAKDIISEIDKEIENASILEKIEEEILKTKERIKELDDKGSDLYKEEIEALKTRQKKLEDLKDDSEKILKFQIEGLRELNEQTKNLQKESKELWGNTWKNAIKTVDSFGNKFSSIRSLNTSMALDTTQSAKALKDMEREAAKLGQRAGQGVEGVQHLTDTFTVLQQKTGESAQNAKSIVDALSTTGYVKNIGEASEYISLFSRATGASNEATVEMMNEFTKVGKFSNKESGTMLASIAKIQKNNGITKAGMDAIASSVKNTVINMKAFGQSDETIKRMVTSTAKLVSEMEKVGISAQVATGWIEKLTDPEKIKENIGLYAQLGVSISDALSGDLDINQALGEGMKDFGQRLKEMGPIAGAEYAKAFGISYKDAIKAADMDILGETEGEVKEDESLKALNDIKDASLDATAAIQEEFNKIGGSMQLMAEKVLIFQTMFSAGWKFPKSFENFSEKIEENNRKIKESQKETIKYINNEFKDYIEARKNALEELATKAKTEGDSAIESLKKQKAQLKELETAIEGLNEPKEIKKILNDLEAGKYGDAVGFDTKGLKSALKEMKNSSNILGEKANEASKSMTLAARAQNVASSGLKAAALSLKGVLVSTGIGFVMSLFTNAIYALLNSDFVKNLLSSMGWLGKIISFATGVDLKGPTERLSEALDNNTDAINSNTESKEKISISNGAVFTSGLTNTDTKELKSKEETQTVASSTAQQTYINKVEAKEAKATSVENNNKLLKALNANNDLLKNIKEAVLNKNNEDITKYLDEFDKSGIKVRNLYDGNQYPSIKEPVSQEGKYR